MGADEESKLPQPARNDHAYGAAKVILSAIPIVGGPAAELFGTVIAPPLAKRRDAWLESLAEQLSALKDKVKGFTIESLRDNDAFVSAVMQATQVAMRTHEREKLDALRSAVLNVAAAVHHEGGPQELLLMLVDQLTPLHLRLLRLFEQGEPVRAQDHAWLESPEIARTLAQDLWIKGLIDQPASTWEGPAEIISREPDQLLRFKSKTTPFGRQFLSFITRAESQP